MWYYLVINIHINKDLHGDEFCFPGFKTKHWIRTLMAYLTKSWLNCECSFKIANIMLCRLHFVWLCLTHTGIPPQQWLLARASVDNLLSIQAVELQVSHVQGHCHYQSSSGQKQQWAELSWTAGSEKLKIELFYWQLLNLHFLYDVVWKCWSLNKQMPHQISQLALERKNNSQISKE